MNNNEILEEKEEDDLLINIPEFSFNLNRNKYISTQEHNKRKRDPYIKCLYCPPKISESNYENHIKDNYFFLLIKHYFVIKIKMKLLQNSRMRKISGKYLVKEFPRKC